MGALVIGASAGVGRAIATALARRGTDLVVSARPSPELTALATDLHTRYDVAVTAVPVDLNGPDPDLRAFLAEAASALDRIDVAVLTAGAVAEGDDGIDDWAQTERLVTTNFVAPMKLGGALIEHFERQGAGRLVLFSSIAAAVPRDRNVAYTAAKAALQAFGNSMRHRVAGTPIAVQIYALGYVDTAMTRGLDLKLPVADAERVAERVVGRLDRGSRFQYLPRPWGVVVRGLRLLPRPVFERLRF